MLFMSTQQVLSKTLPNGGAMRSKTATTLLPGQRSAAGIDLFPLQAILIALTRSCSDALGKSVQYFQGEEAWVIGTMPNCGPLSDSLESESRALLCNSLLTPEQTADVTTCLKVAGDLRTVYRASRQAAQLSWLFRQMPNSAEALELVRPVGEAAVLVATRSADAVERNDPRIARDAALQYRKVTAAEYEAECELSSGLGAYGMTPEMVRMTRASVLFMTIAGESMARIAARVAI